MSAVAIQARKCTYSSFTNDFKNRQYEKQNQYIVKIQEIKLFLKIAQCKRFLKMSRVDKFESYNNDVDSNDDVYILVTV